MEKIVARIDRDLSDLIPGFLARKRSDTRTILSAVRSKDINFETLCGIGHKLKGEGGSYGLDPISVYGAEIELAARSRDTEAIRRYASELAAYLDSLQVEYQ
jgi:HPt (histidine-containing phosphotransfer) domain-containing protein